VVPPGGELIVVDPSSSRRRAWAVHGQAIGVTIKPCGTLAEAITVMAESPVAAVVATISATTGDALRVASAARSLAPPAEVVFVTNDPDTLKTALRARGLMAEVLRRPATIAQLVDRLGLSTSDPPTHSGRGETG
jgi:hypothetical protein